MTTITRSLLALYTPEQMYNLVNDVESYSTFLPWCHRSKIISKSENIIDATLDLTKGGIGYTISTRNKLIKNKSISIRLIDGPFQHLEGCWQFKPISYGSGCRMRLDMNFDFSNRATSIILRPIFTQIISSLVYSFCKRAQDIYGHD